MFASQELIAELAASLPPLGAAAAGDDPRSAAWVSFAHGMAALATGHGAGGRAEALLTDAARLLPECPAVWLGLAEVAWLGGDHATAGRLAAKAAEAASAPPVEARGPSPPASSIRDSGRDSAPTVSAWSLLDARHRRLSDAISLQSAAERRVADGGAGLALANAAVEASEAGPGGALRAEPAAWGGKGTAHLAAFFASEGPGDGSAHLDEARRAYEMAAALADKEAAEAGESAVALRVAAAGDCPDDCGAASEDESAAVECSAAVAAGAATGSGALLPRGAGAANASGSPGSLRDAALTRRSRMFPDVLANRGACLALCLDVSGAARCLAGAHALDPSLGAMASLARLARLAASVARGVAARGHLDERKLAQRVLAWPTEVALEEWRSQADEEGGAGGRGLVRDAVAAVASLGAPGAAGSRALTLAGQAVPLLPLSVVSAAGETPSVVACLDRAGNRVALALYRSAGGATLSRVCRPGMWVAVTDPEVAWVAANPAELAAPAHGKSFEAATAATASAAAAAPAAPLRAKAARKGGKPSKRTRPAAPGAAVQRTADGVLQTASALRFLVVRALGPSRLRVSGMTGFAAGIGSGAKSVLRVGGASH